MTANDMTRAAGRIETKDTAKPSQKIIDAMHVVEQAMHNVVRSDVAILQDASTHILNAGGKRIRPRLMMLGYLACGGTQVADAAPVAAALELVHTASVVHDDINDHGLLRRGRPSVNALWGRTFALLTGDYLFTKVYELMAPYKDLNIIFSEATGALIEGETLQASAVKENNFSREMYMNIISRKTAALFKAGTELGARLADAPEDDVESLAQFGFNVGLAFQIVDDILDLTADDEQLGKTAGIDLQQGKGIASINNNDPAASFKQQLMTDERIQEGQELARSLVETGIASIRNLPDSEYKDELIDLAYLVLDRTQ